MVDKMMLADDAIMRGKVGLNRGFGIQRRSHGMGQQPGRVATLIACECLSARFRVFGVVVDVVDGVVVAVVNALDGL